MRLAPPQVLAIGFSQWIAFKFVRQHNAAKIGMAIKADSKQVEDFALKRVGCGPNRNGAEAVRTLTVHPNFQAQALGGVKRKQVIDNFKPWFLWVKIQGGDIGKKAEFQAGFIPQELAGAQEEWRPNVERHLIAKNARGFNGLRLMLLQLLESHVVLKIDGHRLVGGSGDREIG